MPVVEWLNAVIHNNAEPPHPPAPPVFPTRGNRDIASDHVAAARLGAQRASTLRNDYEKLAADLNMLNMSGSDTALSRASSAARSAWSYQPPANEEPYAANQIEIVEKTIRGIIQHLESSDQRNADTLRQMQTQIRDIATRSHAGQSGDGAKDYGSTFARIEDRIKALASKIEASEPANPDPGASGVENQLAELAEKIKRLSKTKNTPLHQEPALLANGPVMEKNSARSIYAKHAPAAANGDQDTNEYPTDFMRRRARRQSAQGITGGGPAANTGEQRVTDSAPSETSRPSAAETIAAIDKRAEALSAQMAGRFAELARDLEASLSNPSPPQELFDLRELVHDLSIKVGALGAQAAAPAQEAPLGPHIDALTQRLDAVEARFGNLDMIEPTLAHLIERITAAEQGVQQVAAARDGMTQNFERQFTSLFEQLDASRQAMVDAARYAAADAAGEAVSEAAQKAAHAAVVNAQDAAVAAAREAAHSYMQTAADETGTYGAEESRIVEMLQQNLQQLRSELDMSDRKTGSAFEAVQTTLLSIAERMTGFETKLEARDNSPAESAPARAPASKPEDSSRAALASESAALMERAEPRLEMPAANAEAGDAKPVELPQLSQELSGLRLPPLDRPVIQTPEADFSKDTPSSADDAVEQASQADEADEASKESNLRREPGSGPPSSIMRDLGIPMRSLDEPGAEDRGEIKSEAAPAPADEGVPSLRAARSTNEMLAAARRAAEAASQSGGTGQSERKSFTERLRIPLSRIGRSGKAETGRNGSRAPISAANRGKKASAAGASPGARKPIVLAVAAVILFAGSVEIYNQLKKRSTDLLSPPEVTVQEAPAAPETPKSGAVVSPALAPRPDSNREESALLPPGMSEYAAAGELPTGTFASAGEASIPKSTGEADAQADTPSQDDMQPAVQVVPVPTEDAHPAAQVDVADLPELPETVGPVALREAAIGGDPIAQFEVASRLSEGRGTSSDATAAAAWYQLAAASGLAPAQYRLGSLYEKGTGIDKDRNAARVWYERAAGQGNRKAMHNLAVMYSDGVDGQPNFETAARWFRAAAELDLKDSQYNLGILYARGLGLPQNFSESYKWFSILFNRGDKDAGVRRDAIAGKLDPQALAAAKLATQTWKAKRLNTEANAVRLPNEGWALQLSEAPSAKSATSDKSDKPGADIIRSAQKLLTHLGYRPGPVDGQWGPQTIEAIKSFEQHTGARPTGILTPELLLRLQQAQTTS